MKISVLKKEINGNNENSQNQIKNIRKNYKNIDSKSNKNESFSKNEKKNNNENPLINNNKIKIQNSNYFIKDNIYRNGEMNFVFNNFIFIINIINNLNQQLILLQQQKSNYISLKNKGLFAISNSKSINHYLFKNHFIIMINPLNNLYKFRNNIDNVNNQENSHNTFKNKTIMIKEKTKKNNFSTNNKMNIPLNIEQTIEPNISQKNIIIIEDILSGKDKRTVIRLSPIPQNYSSFDISKLIDKYLGIESNKNKRIYKALYAPLSKKIGKNIGYCFVMMVNPYKVIQFYKTFNGINFNKKRCKKNCMVIWANLQGDDFLKVSDDPLRSPIIFKDTIPE